jgi:hypothetical protein
MWIRVDSNIHSSRAIRQAGYLAPAVYVTILRMVKEHGDTDGTLSDEYLNADEVGYFMGAETGLEREIEEAIEGLKRVGLIAEEGDRAVLVKWRKFQPDKTAAERKRRQRERERVEPVTRDNRDNRDSRQRNATKQNGKNNGVSWTKEYDTLIEKWNAITGKAIRVGPGRSEKNLDKVRGLFERCMHQGSSIEDAHSRVLQVVRAKQEEWADTDLVKHVVPETIARHFDKYEDNLSVTERAPAVAQEDCTRCEALGEGLACLNHG